MSDNPFQSPETEGRLINAEIADREWLRKVATYQKGVLYCILLQLLSIVPRMVAPPEIVLIAGLASLAIILAGVVFVFLLATTVYSTLVGVLLAIVALVPCLGLVALLIVNSKATTVLRRHGIKVGLMGAKSGAI